MTFNIEEIYKKYLELKTLQKVADYYDSNIETIRQLFIKNNVNYNKRQKYNCNHEFFNINSKESFYWAGFLAADGNLEKGSNRISIVLNIEDKNHLEKFKNNIISDAPIVECIRKENRPQFKYEEYCTAAFRISSKQIASDLLKFNITTNKSKIYNVNDFILTHKFANHFIRGLIDGDGWVYRKNNNSEIGLSNTFGCVSEVFNFLQEKLKLDSGKLTVRQDGLTIFKSTLLNDNIKIINYLYNEDTISLDRKRVIAHEILLCVPRKIEISKEQLLKTMQTTTEHVAMGKILNVSNSTIKRRLIEYGLI